MQNCDYSTEIQATKTTNSFPSKSLCQRFCFLNKCLKIFKDKKINACYNEFQYSNPNAKK